MSTASDVGQVEIPSNVVQMRATHVMIAAKAGCKKAVSPDM